CRKIRDAPRPWRNRITSQADARRSHHARPAPAPGQPPAPAETQESTGSVQQRVDIAFGIDRMLNSSESTVFIAHALHFIHQPGDLGIYAPSYLLTRNPHPVVEPGKLIIQALLHGAQLRAGMVEAAAITGGVGAAFFRRHLGTSIGLPIKT